MDGPPPRPVTPLVSCRNEVNSLCGTKSRRKFPAGYPQNYQQAAFGCLWKTGAASRLAGALPSYPERTVASLRLSYHSPVCSTTGDAIDRIAAAIDQLATDARGANDKAGPTALAARVAELWLMISALDPELARRKQRYARPADGAPS